MAEQSSRETEPNPAHTERVKSSTEGGGGIKQRQTEQNPAERVESIRERQSEIHQRETEWNPAETEWNPAERDRAESSSKRQSGIQQ